MKATKQKIQQILTETILALCNNGLEYENEMEVDGLLGITLDKKDVFLVKISEVVQGAKAALGSAKNFEEPSSTLTSHSVPEEVETPFIFGKRHLGTPTKSCRSNKRQRHESAPSGTTNGSRSRPRSPCQDFPQDLSRNSQRHRHSSAQDAKVEPLDLRPESVSRDSSPAARIRVTGPTAAEDFCATGASWKNQLEVCKLTAPTDAATQQPDSPVTQQRSVQHQSQSLPQIPQPSTPQHSLNPALFMVTPPRPAYQSPNPASGISTSKPVIPASSVSAERLPYSPQLPLPRSLPDEDAPFTEQVLLQTGHFPTRLPRKGRKDGVRSASAAQKRCRVCYKHGLRKETTYCCPACPGQPGLCSCRCFQKYHGVEFEGQGGRNEPDTPVKYTSSAPNTPARYMPLGCSSTTSAVANLKASGLEADEWNVAAGEQFDNEEPLPFESFSGNEVKTESSTGLCECCDEGNEDELLTTNVQGLDVTDENLIPIKIEPDGTEEDKLRDAVKQLFTKENE